MKLCTFAVSTSLGKHERFGAVIPGGIVDMNSACAWHLARKGEARPRALADVLVPDSLLEFIRGGDTSMGFARATLAALPHGVTKMSADIPGLVETSTNVAVVRTEKKSVTVATSQRSSLASEIDEAIGQVALDALFKK